MCPFSLSVVTKKMFLSKRVVSRVGFEFKISGFQARLCYRSALQPPDAFHGELKDI